MSEYSDGSTYKQPLFYLLPEEVEIVKNALEGLKKLLC